MNKRIIIIIIFRRGLCARNCFISDGGSLKFDVVKKRFFDLLFILDSFIKLLKLTSKDFHVNLT